jgi:hypothetical protein
MAENKNNENTEHGFHLNGQDGAVGTETEEELSTVHKTLQQLKGADGVLVSLTKQDLGLLKQMLHSPEAAGDDFTRIVLICDFLDDDEANNELDAFWEAKRLGMDTNYNVDHALSRAAINRRGAHRNSRVAALMDTMSHQKYTSNTPKGGGGGSQNPRSPLS